MEIYINEPKALNKMTGETFDSIAAHNLFSIKLQAIQLIAAQYTSDAEYVYQDFAHILANVVVDRFYRSNNVEINDQDDSEAKRQIVQMIEGEILTRGDKDELIHNHYLSDIIHEYQKNILHFLAKEGHENIIKIFLMQNIDFNIANNIGQTPLHVAIEHGKIEIIKMLLDDYSVDPNCKDNLGRTPLMVVVETNNLDALKLLLTDQTVIYKINLTDKAGLTALHMAAESGNSDSIQELLNNHANPFLKNNDNKTALDIAKRNKDKTSQKILEDCMQIYNDLFLAVKDGNVNRASELLSSKMINLNFKNEKGDTLLNAAIKNGHLEIVNLLLDNNVNPNQTDSSSFTPLYLAIKLNNPDIMQKILTATGFDINAANQLHLAASRGDSEVISEMLKHGANPNIKITNNEDTPLYIAVHFRKIDVIKTLLSHPNVDPNLKRADGYTPLLTAAYNGDIEILKILLTNDRVDRNVVRVQSNSSALMLAAYRGHANIVAELIKDKDVDLKILNTNGETALHLAVSKGHLEVVNLLLKNGMDPSLKNKNGKSAFDLASENQHEDILDILKNHMPSSTSQIDTTHAELASTLQYAAQFLKAYEFTSDDEDEQAPLMQGTSDIQDHKDHVDELKSTHEEQKVDTHSSHEKHFSTLHIDQSLGITSPVPHAQIKESVAEPKIQPASLQKPKPNLKDASDDEGKEKPSSDFHIKG